MTMRKLWSISTRHIRPSTQAYLADQVALCASNPDAAHMHIMDHGQGWTFLVPDPAWFRQVAQDYGVSELGVIVQAAFDLDALAVFLDADGEVIDELAQFDWS